MQSSKSMKSLPVILAASLLVAAAAFAQSQQQQPQPQQQQQQQPPAQNPNNNKPANPQAAPLTLDSSPAPVSAEEDAAIKAFREAKPDDIAKKDQMGEEFLQKYPQSRYRAEVYSWQVKSYYSKGQIDKMEQAGDKQLALTPDDPQTLALLGSTLPRAMNANTPEPQKRLAKSEEMCKKALDIIPTLQKPDTMTDDVFQRMKSMTLALAYSGLGVVEFRRGKFADAIPDFQQSVKLDPQPDAVNYYLLGISDEKTSHFDDAVDAFNKCSEIQSGIQATCKQNIDEAKKLAATQLSAPK
jgi:tetratricopeptide (TPR) repeat protein